jgi:LasA protease
MKHDLQNTLKFTSRSKPVLLLLIITLFFSSCNLPAPQQQPQTDELGEAASDLYLGDSSQPIPTSLPTRPSYAPGELVEYTAQSGDVLPALAARFNTTVDEIREANPIIPADATTLPEGLPMQIPIYYQALWGSPYQIIPDSLFVYGPSDRDFNTIAFVDSMPGWLKDYTFYVSGEDKRGGELVQYVAQNYSISPRLLLALVDYQTGALTLSKFTDPEATYPLGLVNENRKGLYYQMILAANILNNGYYGWRTGKTTSFELRDGSLEIVDPWQNAATAALHYYYAQVFSGTTYQQATHAQGILDTYTKLFRFDPWTRNRALIPGSLQQPPLLLPFAPGKPWSYTGGPHTGWGSGEPWAAIDFAPPTESGGCTPSNEWVTAVADGVIVRTDIGAAVLDLDGDGDERTGWAIFYLHLLTKSIPPVGTRIAAGEPIGHPSCDGGRSTGTHVHIARKYNGEWIAADSPVAFNLEGWVAIDGSRAYKGELERFGKTIIASEVADSHSRIESQEIVQQ